jgi:hypothetical protein
MAGIHAIVPQINKSEAIYMCKKIILLSAIVSTLFIVGCETMDDAMTERRKTRYVLSFHEVIKYPRSKDLEKKIVSFDGQEFWINGNQFFHSRHITKVDLIPSKEKKGYYDLSLHLDYSGTIKWVQLSTNFRHKELAVLLDGYFNRLYTPDQLAHEEDRTVLLKGPFDKVTAGGIKKYAHKNYLFFNPNKQGLMDMFNNL